MSTVNVAEVPLTRTKNLRANLRRIFKAHPRGHQARIAEDAGITAVYLSNVIRKDDSNPTIDTAEAIAVALEIPVETLLSPNPPDADLRISKKSAERPLDAA